MTSALTTIAALMTPDQRAVFKEKEKNEPETRDLRDVAKVTVNVSGS